MAKSPEWNSLALRKVFYFLRKSDKSQQLKQHQIDFLNKIRP